MIMSKNNLQGSLKNKIDEVNARKDLSESYKKAYVDGVEDAFDLILKHIGNMDTRKKRQCN